MFFVFNKKISKQVSRQFINSNVNTSFKILLISTNYEDVKNLVLPVYFITKNWDAFLTVYSLQTIRNFSIIKNSFKKLCLKKNYQIFLLPSKTTPHLIKIFFLLRIPFHFGVSAVRGRGFGPTEAFALVQGVYGFIKINFYKKIIENL